MLRQGLLPREPDTRPRKDVGVMLPCLGVFRHMEEEEEYITQFYCIFCTNNYLDTDEYFRYSAIFIFTQSKMRDGQHNKPSFTKISKYKHFIQNAKLHTRNKFISI